MRRALRSLFLWGRGWLVFLAGAALVIACSYLVSRTRLFRLVRTWCKLLLDATGIRVEAAGLFPPENSGPMIVIAPHVNVFDPIVLGSIVPWPVVGVELETHFRWPVYGRIIGRLGAIPISHESPHRSRASLREAAECLARGETLVILPEGHRTRTGARGRFGPWAFRLAARTKASVLPLAFDGAWERQHVGSWHLTPGTWRVRILPIVRAAGTGWHSGEALRAAVERAIDAAFAKG